MRTIYQTHKEGRVLYIGQVLQEIFDEIKAYLSSPPVLVIFISRKSFLIYVRAMKHSLAGLLAQDDASGYE